MTQLCLTEICIYPIKSLGGIRLQSAEVLPKGLKYDRRWMLIDEHGQFLTQRKLPAMALFKLSLADKSLIVYHQSDSIEIPTDLHTGHELDSVIWDDKVKVFRVGAKYDQWFADKLGFKCSLVYFPEPHERQVDQQYASSSAHVSLADGFPFLIIGEESLNDLNSRLKNPVPMNRFRPNFVFSGGQAFEEDTWKEIKIGELNFEVVKPCARCALTTVNQQTGIKGDEPLRTLSTFRKQNGKVLFGQNMLVKNTGTVKEGDSIEIIS